MMDFLSLKVGTLRGEGQPLWKDIDTHLLETLIAKTEQPLENIQDRKSSEYADSDENWQFNFSLPGDFQFEPNTARYVASLKSS